MVLHHPVGISSPPPLPRPLKREERNNSGGQTGLPGKGMAESIIPRNPGVPGLFMHQPFRTQRIPAGFLSLLLFNCPAQEARRLDRLVNELPKPPTPSFGCDPVPQPLSESSGRDNPAVGIPPRKSHLWGCWKPPQLFAHGQKADPDVGSPLRAAVGRSPAVPPPLTQLCPCPSPRRGRPQVPGPERGGAGLARGGAGLAAGGSGGGPGAAAVPPHPAAGECPTGARWEPGGSEGTGRGGMDRAGWDPAGSGSTGQGGTPEGQE